MIVICTQCKAKFRVADEKIGPRGTKVRCSKCHTVFVVQGPASAPGAAPRPAAARPAGDLPDAGARAAPTPPPPPRAPAPLDVDLEAPAPGTTPDPSSAPDPFAFADPFAGAGAASPGAPAVRPDDPFLAAALAGRGSLPPDPFAGGRASPEASPTFPSPVDDPFAALGSGRAGRPTTDLADLVGAGGPSSRSEPNIPPDLGIALEDRTTPPAFAAPALDSGTFDPGGFDPAGPGGFDPRGPGAFDPAGPGAFDAGVALGGAGEPLALATEDTPARPPPLPPPLPGAAARLVEPEAEPEPVAAGHSIPLPPDPDAPAQRAAPPGRTPRAVVPPAAPPDRIPGRRGSRVRTVAVNAFALAALLVVALAMRVAWRGDGRLDASALRPSAIVGALRPASADSAPFAAVDVRNGLYEREKAPPVLFVRGTVVARGRAPTVRGVRVAVELVRDGVVVARGDAPAGAVPTPEELWSAADDGALSVVASRAAARAPRAVRAGDAVPFLVALPEYPTDLGGVAVRVAIEPRP